MAAVTGHLVMIGCAKLTDLACDAAIWCKLAMLIQLAVPVLDHVVMICA
jgi:hypothetical protein